MNKKEAFDIFQLLAELAKSEANYIDFMPNRFSKRNKKEVKIQKNDNDDYVEIIQRNEEIYIFIDTCVWINCADKGNFDLFTTLLDLHFQTDARLLIPKQLKDEWDRNKEETLVTSKKNEFNDMLNKTKKFRDTMINDTEKKEELNDLIRQAEHVIEQQIEYINRETMALIDHILDIGILIRTTDPIKLAAADMALQKKAPFGKNKNSMGDAILFQSLISDLKTRTKPILYFVTDNKTDFSESKEIPHKMHPDLLKIANEAGIELNYSLDLRNTLDKILARVTDHEYVNSLEASYNEKYHVNFKNRCKKCNGRMLQNEKEWDGRGNLIYYQCEDCGEIKETNYYLQDQIIDNYN
ncbi:PIN domain-containing protein [Bacillus mycoides]